MTDIIPFVDQNGADSIINTIIRLLFSDHLHKKLRGRIRPFLFLRLGKQRLHNRVKIACRL